MPRDYRAAMSDETRLEQVSKRTCRLRTTSANGAGVGPRHGGAAAGRGSRVGPSSPVPDASRPAHSAAPTGAQPVHKAVPRSGSPTAIQPSEEPRVPAWLFPRAVRSDPPGAHPDGRRPATFGWKWTWDWIAVTRSKHHPVADADILLETALHTTSSTRQSGHRAGESGREP